MNPEEEDSLCVEVPQPWPITGQNSLLDASAPVRLSSIHVSSVRLVGARVRMRDHA